MTGPCIRGPGSFSVASSPCRTHQRPLIYCILDQARALLTRGALELPDDRAYEEWQADVAHWLEERGGRAT